MGKKLWEGDSARLGGGRGDCREVMEVTLFGGGVEDHTGREDKGGWGGRGGRGGGLPWEGGGVAVVVAAVTTVEAEGGRGGGNTGKE